MPAPEETVALADLRRHVVAAQGYATRFRRATSDDVAATVRRLSCVQLDSIATVDRSHRIVIGTRAGAAPAGTTSRLLGEGRLFEYWAHEASLVPVEDYPLFRRRMMDRRVHHWWGPVIAKDRALAKKVLDAVRERGPLGSKDFEGAGGGGMWKLKPAKRMLDALWTAGELVVSGRRGFQRLYDLPERVIPAEHLEAPVPTEEDALRALTMKAVAARGALTERGVVDHYRVEGGVRAVKAAADALVAEGALRRVAVDDEGPPVLLPADADVEAARVSPDAGVLVSPFDNLLWDRRFSERVFGFRHVIEVYKREHEREYGYYVLPFLVGDRVVGRADLKADRAESVLRVRARHLEPGVRASSRVEDAFAGALARLARMLGLADGESLPPW